MQRWGAWKKAGIASTFAACALGKQALQLDSCKRALPSRLTLGRMCPKAGHIIKSSPRTQAVTIQLSCSCVAGLPEFIRRTGRSPNGPRRKQATKAHPYSTSY